MVLLAKHPKVTEYDWSFVKTISCGAAPLSAEVEEAVMKKLKVTNIQQGMFFYNVNKNTNCPSHNLQVSIPIT